MGQYKRNRLLIVDDEEALQRMYQEEFEDDGYAVVVAGNGREALKIVFETSFDAVILDIRMPELNGIDTLRILKILHPKLPVILCSAYSEFKQDFSVWASDDYVVKSSFLDELKTSVKSVCDNDKYESNKILDKKATIEKLYRIAMEEDNVQRIDDSLYVLRMLDPKGADPKCAAIFDKYYRIAMEEDNAQRICDSFKIMSQTEPNRALPILLDLGLRHQKNGDVREKVVTLLKEYPPDNELRGQMIFQLNDKSSSVRQATSEVLGFWGEHFALNPLKEMLSDPEGKVRETAKRAIDKISNKLKSKTKSRK